ASDLAVHREICGEVAAYFPRFSSEALAGTVAQIAALPERLSGMKAAGLERSTRFSWKEHVEMILELCRNLIASKNPGCAA
ncbi:MAG TPA: hypothetical protein VF938_07515, partial [Candidatus Angelobacter sp.]